jgi:alkanesulfonate monooxygenase SsuD/methylene tetrahydromethanopterin reductase-like flavin-dependent oxidoreductase (luciferase family)
MAGQGRPLQIGIMLPDTEREMAGGSARWADLLAMARTAEGCGFDSLWVSDHLIFRFEGKEPQGVWECWSLLSALAASTSRVELGPLVSATSFRNPALLAKIAATVDEIAGGRLVLGLGAGWHEPEYAAFGYPFDHRVSRFEEALAIVRGLLRDGRVDFAGDYYTAATASCGREAPAPAGRRS